MIDPALFTVGALLRALLADGPGCDNMWMWDAEIVPGYMPPYPSKNTRPSCIVRYGDSFLRHSCGPRQGHFWDVYGDDYLTPSLALLALVEAPVPPRALTETAWNDARHARDAFMARLAGLKPLPLTEDRTDEQRREDGDA